MYKISRFVVLVVVAVVVVVEGPLVVLFVAVQRAVVVVADQKKLQNVTFKCYILTEVLPPFVVAFGVAENISNSC